MTVTSHNWNGVTATVYYLDDGERIPRHKHNVEHTTAVLCGRTQVEVANKPTLWMVATDGSVTLPADVEHEITALVDGTIVMNMIAGAYTTTTPADGPPAQGGGVLLHDGTVVAHEAD